MTQFDDYTEEEKAAIKAHLELKEKLKREREIEDIKQIMSTEAGRRFVWRITSSCGVFDISFTNDPYVTAFNEGARNQGLMLLSDVMEFCAEQYLLMAEEAKEQESNQ
ncbi:MULTISPECIES: Bbp19 family protein [Providencia]|uniref:Bbp19 family protein n=1 Tax=Providencia TaxID=586 RepID=UPI001120B9DA|nr:hypothetical protein [Providencia sp. PROV077]